MYALILWSFITLFTTSFLYPSGETYKRTQEELQESTELNGSHQLLERLEACKQLVKKLRTEIATIQENNKNIELEMDMLEKLYPQKPLYIEREEAHVKALSTRRLHRPWSSLPQVASIDGNTNPSGALSDIASTKAEAEGREAQRANTDTLPVEYSKIHALAYGAEHNELFAYYASGIIGKWDIDTMLYKKLNQHDVHAFCIHPQGGFQIIAKGERGLAVWLKDLCLWSTTKDPNARDIIHLYPANTLRFISVHANGLVKVWDLLKHNCIATLMKRSQPFSVGCITRGGYFVGALDKELVVRTLEFTAATRTLTVPTYVFALCADPIDPQQVIVGGNSIYRIDVRSRHSVCLDCEGKITALYSGGTTASFMCAGTENGTIYVWSLPEYKLVASLRGHTAPIRHLIMDARKRIISVCDDGLISLWIWEKDTQWRHATTFKPDVTKETQ